MWNKSERTTLLILMPLVLSTAISMDIFVPSIPDIAKAFNADSSLVQWTLSIYMLGCGIGQLICGPITDRFGRKKVVLTGILIYVIGTIICFLAPSINILIFGRLFQSLGSCASIVVGYAIVRDIYSTEKGAVTYSHLGSVTMLAPVLAPMIGGYLSIIFGSWRSSFAFLLLFGLIAFLSSLFFISETLAKHKRIPINFKELFNNFSQILKNMNFLSYSFITLSCMIALFCFCGISPFLLISSLHVSKPLYAVCFGSNALSFIIAGILSPILSKRFGMPLIIFWGLLITLIGSTWMYFINHYEGLSILNFMMPMATISFGLGLSFGLSTAQALSDFEKLAGTASALLTSIQFLGAGIVGSIIISYSTHSAEPFAILMIIVGVLSFILYGINNFSLIRSKLLN